MAPSTANDDSVSRMASNSGEVVVVLGDDRRVPRRLRRSLHAIHQFGEERVDQLGHNEADRARPARDERPGQHVRAVFQLLDGLQDASAVWPLQTRPRRSPRARRCARIPPPGPRRHKWSICSALHQHACFAGWRASSYVIVDVTIAGCEDPGSWFGRSGRHTHDDLPDSPLARALPQDRVRRRREHRVREEPSRRHPRVPGARERRAITLFDIDAERLATSELVAHRVARALGASPSIVATTDRRGHSTAPTTSSP